MTKLWKWSGAGNLFVVIDGRDGGSVSDIQRLCREHGTDGLMVLRKSASGRDFAMEFYNPDGSSGMMCGNGGRCIAAFADMLGVRPADGGVFRFDAPDGVHTAEILQRPADPATGEWTVRLGMIDVNGITEYPDGLFLNTGTRHFVKFVPDVETIDIEVEALPIRNDARFAPEGTNVNFVQTCPVVKIRTFEKGVEGETAACGTGITASAIACRYSGIAPSAEGPDSFDKLRNRICYRIQAREATLSVDFIQKKKDAFSDVFLTGPARILAE